MDIISLKRKINSGVCEIITKDYHTGKIILPKNWRKEYNIISWWWSWMLGYLIQSKVSLNGEFWVKTILHYIKNVKVTEEEFEKRKAKDGKIRENDFKDYDWDFENNPLYFHIQWTPEKYWDDKLSTIPYNWSDGEVYHANSYVDVTEVHNNDGTQVEYYSTPEIIEVLEKWIEALERWNHPEERKHMIEEYEREHTEEK